MSAPLLLLATYAVMRYGLTDVESVARRETVRLLGLIWLFFLMMNCVRHRWQLTWVMWAGLAAGCGVALDGVWQLLRNHSSSLGQNLSVAGPHEMVRGTFANPEDFVVYLHLLFPVAAANFLFSRRSLPARVLCAFACVLLMIGMAIAGEWRYWIGWLASTTVLGVCLLRKRGWKFRWAMVGGAVLLVVVGAAWLAISRLEVFAPGDTGLGHPGIGQATSSHTQTATQEVPLWRSTASIALRHPWLGVGPGMFRWYYPTVRGMQINPTDAGNEFLTFAVEYGFIGMLLMVWAGLAFFGGTIFILRARIRRYSAAITSNRYAFAVAGLAAATAAIVDGWLGCGFHSGANQLTLVALAAAALTCGLHNEADKKLHEFGRYTVLQLRGINRGLLIAGAVVMMGLLWWKLYRTYPSEFFIWRAHRAAAQGEWRTASNLYQKARHVDERSTEATVGLGDTAAAQAATSPQERVPLYTDAIHWYTEVLNRYNPRAFEVRMKLGQAYDALGNREQARDCLKLAVQNDPRNASYHLALGQHYQRWDDLDLAKQSYQRASQLDPSTGKQTVPTPPVHQPSPADDTETP